MVIFHSWKITRELSPMISHQQEITRSSVSCRSCASFAIRRQVGCLAVGIVGKYHQHRKNIWIPLNLYEHGEHHLSMGDFCRKKHPVKTSKTFSMVFDWNYIWHGNTIFAPTNPPCLPIAAFCPSLPISWLYPTDLKPTNLIQGSTIPNHPQIVVYELTYKPANRMIDLEMVDGWGLFLAILLNSYPNNEFTDDTLW